MQQNLFNIAILENNSKKTYRAIRHDITREKQNANSNKVHHPKEKINQIKKVLKNKYELNILELFAGQGNLTKIFNDYGKVDAYDKKYLKTGDSFLVFHKLISEKKKYNVIDLDPYGFPNRFFPDVFMLIEEGIMFVTMPKPYVNILNGITASHLISYYGQQNPSKETIIERIALWGICHWRQVELIDCMDCKSIWRFAFNVKKVKATEYTGVKNR
jgi:tRNA G26 N,N-dimethylase Trm1